jgi:hypothetical protein
VAKILSVEEPFFQKRLKKTWRFSLFFPCAILPRIFYDSDRPGKVACQSPEELVSSSAANRFQREQML